MSIAKITTLVLLSSLSSLALAADPGLFFDASVGRAQAKVSAGNGISNDRNDTTLQLGGGYYFTPYIGLEAGYRNLGKTSMSSSSAVLGTFLGKTFQTAGGFSSSTDTDGFYLGPVVNYSVTEKISLTGRAGIYHWNDDASVSGPAGTFYDGKSYAAGSAPQIKNSGTDSYYGVGGLYQINSNVDVGLNYSRLKADTRKYDVVDVRLQVGF